MIVDLPFDRDSVTMKNMMMNNFKERVRKRMDTKIEPFKRFPLMSEKREIAHDALNHTREALGLRADIEVRPLGTQEQAVSKIYRTTPSHPPPAVSEESRWLTWLAWITKCGAESG